MKNLPQQTFHQLTNEVKDYFAKDRNNDFLQKLKTLIEVDGVDVFPDEQDDCDVIIIFPEQKNALTSIIFSDGGASVEYSFEESFIWVPFCYENGTDKKTTTFFAPIHDLISQFHNYELKGMQKLFKDILWLVENIVARKAYIEQIGGKAKSISSKCRLYIAPNETVACGKKWKDKHKKSPKLQTIRL